MGGANIMKWVLAALVVIAIASTAQAAEVFSRPFGISMGEKIKALDHPRRMGGTDVNVRSVPEPHPLLARYSVVATDAAGVCQVKGYAPLSRDGSRKVDAMVRHLGEVFGEPRLLPGNRDPDCTGIWLWSLNERDKGDVELVTVHRYEQAGKTAAIVTFEFANHKDCEPAPTPNPFK